MDHCQYLRHISQISNENLRDILQYGVNPDLARDRFEDLLFQNELLNEVVRRLWDEFEGYRDSYSYPKFKADCPYLDDEAEDGWAAFDECLKPLRENVMDKQIRKVEKDVVKGDKKKAEKDIKTLKKMDKKFDKKIDKAKKVMKGKC